MSKMTTDERWEAVDDGIGATAASTMRRAMQAKAELRREMEEQEKSIAAQREKISLLRQSDHELRALIADAKKVTGKAKSAIDSVKRLERGEIADACADVYCLLDAFHARLAVGAGQEQPKCRWCADGSPEWSYDAKGWIHRREHLDRRCDNPPSRQPDPRDAEIARLTKAIREVRSWFSADPPRMDAPQTWQLNRGRAQLVVGLLDAALAAPQAEPIGNDSPLRRHAKAEPCKRCGGRRVVPESDDEGILTVPCPDCQRQEGK